jgi:hypothetical protein
MEENPDEIDERLGDLWSMTEDEGEQLWRRMLVVAAVAAVVAGVAIWLLT